MPQEKPSIVIDDLFSRIEKTVDLSKPRDLEPVPEGYEVIGTLSEKSKKIFCFGFDLAKEIQEVEQEHEAACKAYASINKTKGNANDLFVEHYKAVATLGMRIKQLYLFYNVIQTTLLEMVGIELHEAGKHIPNIVMFNEEFVISVPPTLTLTEIDQDMADIFTGLARIFTEMHTPAKPPQNNEIVPLENTSDTERSPSGESTSPPERSK